MLPFQGHKDKRCNLFGLLLPSSHRAFQKGVFLPFLCDRIVEVASMEVMPSEVQCFLVSPEIFMRSFKSNKVQCNGSALANLSVCKTPRLPIFLGRQTTGQLTLHLSLMVEGRPKKSSIHFNNSRDGARVDMEGEKSSLNSIMVVTLLSLATAVAGRRCRTPRVARPAPSSWRG